MKEVVYTKQALLQFEESVKELVEQGYFGEEDYAIMYMRDIFRHFALNLQNSVSVAAPESLPAQPSMSPSPAAFARGCR